MHQPPLFRIYLLALLVLASWLPAASAFEQYSVSTTAGNCADCHGNFRANSYTSLADGQIWTSGLHNTHRFDMLGGDCNTCHNPSARFPVFLNFSTGGAGFDPISCIGCHGRSETQAGDQVTGAGLRQHHFNSGEQICLGCHADSDPAVFTAVGENVDPPYYFTPDAAHPAKPTDPCSLNGEENFAGGPTGLDNDGDTLYDQNDSDCQAVADINLNPAALDFGAVFIGQSATLTSQIENVGNADLTVTSVTPATGTSTEFSFTAPATPFTIPAGGSQTVSVTYAPVDVGLDTGALDINSDDPDEPTVSLALSGTGQIVPEADINLVPTALDFGTVLIGSSAVRTTEVQNLGTADLTVSAIDLCAGTSMEFSWMPGVPIPLAPGASQTLTVTYAPVDIGLDTGCLALTSNDPDEAVVELALSGTGAPVPVADINLNPASLDFGVVFIGDSATLTSQIENVGDADLTVNSIVPAMGTSPDFSFMAPATPFVIPPGGSETVTVTYMPSDVGPDTGALDISSDDLDEPTVSLALSGTGQIVPEADINLVPAVLDFGTVFRDDSAMLSTEIQNLGTADLIIDVIDLCVSTSMEFSWMPGAPITIPPGGSQILTVTYAPIDLGTDTGCLAISSNDPDEATVELGLAGSGVEPPVGDINLDPAALDFGLVTIGNTAMRTSQIQNLGDADLTVNSIVPEAGTSPEFSFTAPATPFTIPVGGSQAVMVTYAPVDVGMDMGALEISSDDPDEPTVRLVLSGTGEPQVIVPDINLDPAALDFGTVIIGKSAMRSTEIQNLGTADLMVMAIDRCAGTSMEFSWMPAAPITLAPGASQTLTVTYAPVDEGPDVGCLAIASNDPYEPTVELGLSGTGDDGDMREVNIKLPGAINTTSQGVTPIKFYSNMDLEIVDVECGRNKAMPKRLNMEDFNADGYMDVVGLFETKDLGVQCGDTTLSCTGTLAGGFVFEGTSSVFKTVGPECEKVKVKDKDDDED